MTRVALLWVLSLVGCATIGPIGQMHADVVNGLTQADVDEWAEQCAPRELALARSHSAFAELEFEQGDARRAQEHLEIATVNIAIALEKADACRPKDRDGDGFMDNEDGCPDDPEIVNGYRDSDGCPDYDTDGDGVFDPDDKCVNEPEDLDNFMDSDGCPELDNDGDGLPDKVDACPNAKEIFNGVDDEDGCPDQVLDTDGDGILDEVDQCIQQPENYNEYLDEDGCPDTKPQNVQITKDEIKITEKILFETNRARILPVSYGILDAVSQVLKDYPRIRVRVEGHTDSDGSDAYNLKLSQSRAESVVEYLVKSGIDRSRLDPVGYGETKPIDTNRTSEGKANNRRVEFHIVEGM